MGDVTAPIDEDTHLTPDLTADLRELTGEVVGDEAVGGQSALVQTLDRADLTGLETVGVAEDLDGRLLGQLKALHAAEGSPRS